MSQETTGPAAESTPPERCPLCGGPNGCGLAAGAGTCWCFSAGIPAATLARVPEADRDRSCICAACAGQADASTASSAER